MTGVSLPADVTIGAREMDLPSRMSARAAVRSQLQPGRDGRLRSVLAGLRSEAPLVLRPVIEAEPFDGALHVCVAAGAAGPVGGDRLHLDIEVGAGSTLVLTEVSSTLVLPGRDGARSCTKVAIRVGPAGTFAWLPEPVIAAQGCVHINDVRVDLAADARLLVRDEVILGREGESGGQVRQRMRVRRGGAAVYCQDLELGTDAAKAPSILADHRSIGSILVVDPDWRASDHPIGDLPGDATVMNLPAGGVLVSALSADNLALRGQLDAGLVALDLHWGPRTMPPTLEAVNVVR